MTLSSTKMTFVSVMYLYQAFYQQFCPLQFFEPSTSYAFLTTFLNFDWTNSNGIWQKMFNFHVLWLQIRPKTKILWALEVGLCITFPYLMMILWYLNPLYSNFVLWAIFLKGIQSSFIWFGLISNLNSNCGQLWVSWVQTWSKMIKTF